MTIRGVLHGAVDLNYIFDCILIYCDVLLQVNKKPLALVKIRHKNELYTHVTIT